MKKLYTLFFISLFFHSFSQKLNVSGNVQDTAAKQPLPYAVVMAVRLMDSTLVNFTRTDGNGLFKLESLPIDTYQVIISHPKFADQAYFIFGDKKNLDYDFGKIILQPKNVSLDEVTIFAFKDPIYYKGDTLIYTADSFKVKANATVEDLLKKLPGLKVDKDGKITSQGKAVDKVLVDGDEFFGSDPTVATKNLNASAIESVQVYEKKSDDAANSNTGEETQKILNLKLKDEAKKGYFGKVSAASDFQKFYEGEALANYFKKKLKVSVFGLVSNTPRSSFGWNDVFKYGLNNEMNMGSNDEGDNFYYSNNNQNQGIPQTLKSGFYYSDRLSKKTKIGFNYSYNFNQLNSRTSNNSQYFLSDTTYSTANENQSLRKNETHNVNFTLDQQLDSLTDLSLISKVKVLSDRGSSIDQTDFIREDNARTRNTSISNNTKSSGYELNNTLKLNRRFKKKDRLLMLSYNNMLSKNESEGLLKTDNSFYVDTSYISSVDQRKTNLTNTQNHFVSGIFTEPLTKKIKLEVSYDFMYYKSTQDKKALNNIGGEYTQLDSNFTNNFITNKQINRAGLKFIYEVKKLRFAAGTKARNVMVNNNNIFKNQQIKQNFNNILPFAALRYKFSDNKNIDFRYTTNSSNPTVSQLQPVPDNTNPNFINIGNPNLLPTFNNEFNVNYNSWKPISGKYTWFGLNYALTDNDFSERTFYDSIGRSVSQTINVDGNSSGSFYIGTSIPFFSKKLELQPNANGSFSNNKTIINNQENRTQDLRTNIGLEIRLNFEKITAGLTGYAEYNQSSSTLNTNSTKPYTAQGLVGNIGIDLPKKFRLESDATYTMNGQRSNGYNINYLVWNASLTKTFFKMENFIVGLYAYDMLNQNISVNRNINSNIISDTKTNIISRYFLLKATFKFNSNKTKEEGNDD
jgi:hypothetical protein